jgi:hypothetical protein
MRGPSEEEKREEAEHGKNVFANVFKIPDFREPDTCFGGEWGVFANSLFAGFCPVSGGRRFAVNI